MKKIFKAILAISIIGAMALGFAACGGNGGSDAIAVISREEGSGTRGALFCCIFSMCMAVPYPFCFAITGQHSSYLPILHGIFT